MLDGYVIYVLSIFCESQIDVIVVLIYKLKVFL
jgi:hypothetical protein